MKILLKENEPVYLGDEFLKDMKYFTQVWNFLNGKKTYLAMALLFVYGGLSYLGFEYVWLKDVALLIGGIGLTHGAVKKFK